MMVNSDKGLQTISSLHLKLKEVSFTDAITGNPVYTNPVSEPYKRKQCFYLLNNSDISISELAQKLLKVSLID